VTISGCGGDKYSPTGKPEDCTLLPEAQDEQQRKNVFSRQVSLWVDGISMMTEGIETEKIFIVATNYPDVGGVLYALEKDSTENVGSLLLRSNSNGGGGRTVGGYPYGIFKGARDGVGQEIRFGKILALSSFSDDLILCTDMDLNTERQARLRLLYLDNDKKKVTATTLPMRLKSSVEHDVDVFASHFGAPSGLAAQSLSSRYVWIADSKLKVVFRVEKQLIHPTVSDTIPARVWIGTFQDGLSTSENLPLPTTHKFFGPSKLIELGDDNILILDKYAMWVYPGSSVNEQQSAFYVCGLVDASLRNSIEIDASFSSTTCDSFKIGGFEFLDVSVANNMQTVYVLMGSYGHTLIFSFDHPTLSFSNYSDMDANAARSHVVKRVHVQSADRFGSAFPLQAGYIWTGFVQEHRSSRGKGGRMVMQSLQNPQTSMYGMGISVQEMSGDSFLCKEGLFYSKEKNACMQVPAGTFAGSWSSFAMPCPVGTVSNNALLLDDVGRQTESVWCRQCGRLDYWTDEAGALNCIKKCDYGKIFNKTTQQCSASCDHVAGFYFDVRLQGCVQCPLGMKARVQPLESSIVEAQGVQSFCEKCDIGFYGSSPGVCSACPGGQIAPYQGSTKCSSLSSSNVNLSNCGAFDGLYEYCSEVPTRMGNKTMRVITSMTSTSRGVIFRTDGFRIEKSITQYGSHGGPADVKWQSISVFPWSASSASDFVWQDHLLDSKYILKYSSSALASTIVARPIFHLIEVTDDETTMFYASYQSTCIYKSKIANTDQDHTLDKDYLARVHDIDDRIPWAGDCSEHGRMANEMNGLVGVGKLGMVKDMVLMQVSGKADVLFVSTDATDKFGCMSIRSISLFDGHISTFISNDQLLQPRLLSSSCIIDIPYRLAVGRGSDILYYSKGSEVFEFKVFKDDGIQLESKSIIFPGSSSSSASPESLSMCVNPHGILSVQSVREHDMIDILDPRYPNLIHRLNASAGNVMMSRTFAKMMGCAGQRIWFVGSSTNHDTAENEEDIVEISVPLEAVSHQDIHCIGGYIAHGAAENPTGIKKACVQVGIGRFTDPEGSLRACPVGTFGRIAGSASFLNCQKCPSGSIVTLEGSGGGCDWCPPNQPYDINGKSCSSICPTGYFKNNEKCESCPLGFSSAENAVGFSGCVQCPANTYSGPDTLFVCKPCETGYVSPTGAFQCTRICPDNQCSLNGRDCVNLVYSYEVITSVVLDALSGSVIAAPLGSGVFYTDGNVLGYFYDDCPAYISKFEMKENACKKDLVDLLPKIENQRYFQAFAMGKKTKVPFLTESGLPSTTHEVRYLYVNTWRDTCSIYRLPIVYKVSGTVDVDMSRRHLAMNALGRNSLQNWLYAGKEVCDNRAARNRTEPLSEAVFYLYGDMHLSDDEEMLYVSDILGNTVRAIDMKRGNVVTILGEASKSTWKEGVVPTVWGLNSPPDHPYAYAGMPNGMGIDSNGNIYLAMKSRHAVGLLSGTSAFVKDGHYLNNNLNAATGRLDSYCSMSFADVNKFLANETIVLEESSCAPTSPVSCFLRGAFDVTVYDSKVFVSVEHGIVAIDKNSLKCSNVGGKIWDLDKVTGIGNVDGEISESRFNMPFRVSMAQDRGILYISDRNNRAIRRIFVSGKCRCPDGFVFLEKYKSCYNPNPPDGSRELKSCPFGQFALDHETVCRPCEDAVALRINNAGCIIWRIVRDASLTGTGFSYSKVKGNPFPLLDKRSDWFGGPFKQFQVSWNDMFAFDSTVRYALGGARGHVPYGLEYASLTYQEGTSCDLYGDQNESNGCWVVESRQDLKPKIILPGIWYPCNDPEALKVNEQNDQDAAKNYKCSCPWNLAEFDSPNETSCRSPTWSCLRLAAIENEGRALGSFDVKATFLEEYTQKNLNLASDYRIQQWSRYVILGTDENARETVCSEKGNGKGPCFPTFQHIRETTASNLYDPERAERGDFHIASPQGLQWSRETNVKELKCGTGWPSHYYCPDGYMWVAPNTSTLENNKDNIFVSEGSKLAPVVTCLSCLPGSFSKVPMHIKTVKGGPYHCEPCSSGKFSSSVGSTECKACPDNTYATLIQGSPNCTPCPKNHYSFSGSWSLSQCSPCRPGTGSCKECVPGQFQNQAAQDNCEVCRPGHFSNALNQTFCYECDVNTYQPSAGQAGCMPCPLQSFAMSKGSRSCTTCAPESLLECDLVVNRNCGRGCGLNFYYDTESKKCVRCPGGSLNAFSTCAKSSTICDWAADGSRYIIHSSPDPDSGEGDTIGTCPPGSGSKSLDFQGCAFCLKGQFSDGMGSSGCADCPVGTFSNETNSSACIECAPGTFSSQRGATSCELCSEGMHARQARAAACVDCPAGTFAPYEGLATCLPCSNGTFGNQTKQIHDCIDLCDASEGWYSGQGATACTKCESGIVSAQDISKCVGCGKGMYAKIYGVDGYEGEQQCAMCPPGKYNSLVDNGTDVNATCLSCPSPTLDYVDPLSNNTACLRARPGYVANGEQTGEIPCPIGMYRSNETECQPCPAGSMQPRTGQVACILCPAGSSQPEMGRTQCIECDFLRTGKTTSATGSVACENCPLGHRAVSNTRCSICAKNTYRSSATRCSLCSDGKVSYPGSHSIENCTFCGEFLTLSPEDGGTCKQCEPGKYTVAVNAIANTEPFIRYDCVSCPAGRHNPFFGSRSDLDCRICEGIGYVPSPNQTLCIRCLPGQTALSEASECTLCPKGTFSPNGESCIPCPPGFFSASDGSSQCVPCPQGQYTNQSGQMSCVLCEPGKYANHSAALSATEGSVQCKTCTSDLGYADEYGTVQCKKRRTTCSTGQHIILNFEDSTSDHKCGDCVMCDPSYQFCVKTSLQSNSNDPLGSILSMSDENSVGSSRSDAITGQYCPVENGKTFMEQYCPGHELSQRYMCIDNVPEAGRKMRVDFDNVAAGGAVTVSSGGGAQIVYETCSDIESTQNAQTKALMGYVKGPSAMSCYVGCKYGLIFDGVAKYMSEYGYASSDDRPRQNVFLPRVLDSNVYPPLLCNPCPTTECPLGRFRPAYDIENKCGPPCSLNVFMASPNNCSTQADGCIGTCMNAPSNSSFIDGSHELDNSLCPWRCHEGFFLSDNKTKCLSCKTDILCAEGFAKVPLSECRPDLTMVSLCKACVSMGAGGTPYAYSMELESCLYRCTLGSHYASPDSTYCFSCMHTNKTCPVGEYLDVLSCVERGVEPMCRPCMQNNDTVGKLAFTSHGGTDPDKCEGLCIVGYNRVYRISNAPVPLVEKAFAKDVKCELCIPGDGVTCQGKCAPGSYRNLQIADGLPDSCVPCRQSLECGIGRYAKECSTGNETVNPPCIECESSLLFDSEQRHRVMDFVPYDYKYIANAFTPTSCPRMCRVNHILYDEKCITCDSYVKGVRGCEAETKSAMFYEAGQPKPCDFKYSHWNATDDLIWWKDPQYTPSHMKSYVSISDSPYVVDKVQKIYQRAGVVCWACPVGTGTSDDRGDQNLCEVLPGYGRISEYEVETTVIPIPSSASEIYIGSREPRKRTLSRKSSSSVGGRRRMLSVTLNISSMQTTSSALVPTSLILSSSTSPSGTATVNIPKTTSPALRSQGPAVGSCPIGFYNSGNSSFCVRCPEGTSTTSVLKMKLEDCLCFWGFRRDIPLNTSSRQTLSTSSKSAYRCVPCGVDKYRPPKDVSELECLACSANETTFDTQNATKCACKPGYYRKNGMTGGCELCPGGHACIASYDNENSWPAEGTHRIECMANGVSLNGSVSIENCTCRSGFMQRWRKEMPYSNGSIGVEKLLQTNTYCAENPPNSVFDNVTRSLKCKEGWRATYEKNVMLTQDGKQTGDVIKSCYLCNPGEFAEQDPSIPVKVGSQITYPALNCMKCPLGSYTDSTITIGQCKRCPNNTNTKTAGSTHYEDCGCAYPQVLSKDNKSCVGCLGTEYRLNNHSCKGCPLNSEARVGASSVQDCMCLPGFYAISVSNMTKGCAVCPRGSYSSFSSNNGCLRCPYLTTTPSAGSKSIKECNICEKKDHCLVMSGKQQVCMLYIYVPGARLVNGACILSASVPPLQLLK